MAEAYFFAKATQHTVPHVAGEEPWVSESRNAVANPVSLGFLLVWECVEALR